MNLGSRDANTGAKRAREARSAYGLDADAPPECVLSFVADVVGLHVVVAELNPGVSGVCWGAGTSTPLLAVRKDDHATRQRFTLAHELGHVCCGHTGELPKDSPATLRDWDHDPREVQANAFAGELLMPEARFLDLVGEDPSLDELVRAAETFNVSTQAVVVRARRMRRYDWTAYQAMWVRIEALEHLEARERLGCIDREDGLHPAPERPWFSPALRGGALAAVLAGDASIETAAAHNGMDPEALRQLVHAITGA